MTLLPIRSLKERQSQSTQDFILGNPHGEENPAKLLYYRFNQVQCQDVALYHQERITPQQRRIALGIN